MLRNKDITKIEELKYLFKKNWTEPIFFQNQLNLFKFYKSNGIFESAKKRGVPLWDLMRILVTLSFANIQSVNSMFNSAISPNENCKKDTFYRMLSNQKINWRSLLLVFVKRYIQLDKRFNNLSTSPKCLIFDDTDIEKTGTKIEGISKIYNHVNQTHVFGFKLLVAGYWNGSAFIPVDFSFHRESKNSKKKYGLSVKQQKHQKSTVRDSKTYSAKRFKELNIKKNIMIVDMFKRIKKRVIKVDYILIDSWFTTISLISNFRKTDKNVNIIGMYKYNSKVNIEGVDTKINELKKSKKGIKRSRKNRFYNLSFIGKIDSVEVRLFLSRRGKNGAWHVIITTDTSLTFNKMIEIYNIRWSIEVFFKEAKQLLNLGRSQSTNFDVQIAQTTITMIQYLMISLKFRVEAYETLSGLFSDLKQDYLEHKLNERINLVIIEIFAVLELIIPSFDVMETISRLITYSEKFEYLGKLSISQKT